MEENIGRIVISIIYDSNTQVYLQQCHALSVGNTEDLQ
jgi:hypothetical protein